MTNKETIIGKTLLICTIISSIGYCLDQVVSSIIAQGIIGLFFIIKGKGGSQ